MKRIFVIFFLLAGPALSANHQLVTGDDLNSYKLQPYLYFFTDHSKELTIEDILRREDELFTYHENNFPFFAYNYGAQWGKFTWDCSRSIPQRWYLLFDFFDLETVSVYVLTQNGISTHMELDANHPFAERIFPSRKPIFPIETDGSVMTVYFRVTTLETMELPLKLYTAEGLVRKKGADMFFKGGYYGIIIIIFLYNLFICISMRDRSYLYYVLYIAFFIVTQLSMDGFLHEHLFPEDYETARNIRIYMTSLLGIVTLLFASNFLDFRHRHPRLYILYIVLLPVVMLPATVQFLFGFQATSLVTMFLMFSIALIQIITSGILSLKNIMARYYFFAWFFFFIGVIFFSLRALNIYIPYVSAHGIQWGNAAEVAVLSFGLAYRMKILKNENENLKFSILHERTFPHFLFNSLSAVSGIINERLYKKAQKIIYELAELYQYVTYKSFQKLVSLKKELEFCEKYLFIMKERFDGLITYNFTLKGEIQKITVPPFTVQPILENVIKHGFQNNNAIQIDVTIEVRPRERTSITITNDGFPLADETVQGQTLQNIVSCLKLNYEYAGLVIKNGENGGVVTLLTFSGRKKYLNE